MRVYRNLFFSLVVLFLAAPTFAQKTVSTTGLWRDRGDIAMLDLLNGAGGKAHQPGTHFKFIEESKSGSSPKFDVVDENGTKWKVKLGPEVKSETAATHLVWAAGYFTDEDYYRPEIRVEGMHRLSRGRKYVSKDGLVREVRLERHGDGKATENWSWYQNPYSNTREFNGLRVMMALINNWDLKEVNNDVLVGGGESRYEVADLGASFGRTGKPFGRSKGVLKHYAKSEFIQKVNPESVDLVMHSRPLFLTIINFPNYRFRTRMESVAKRIPLTDAKWMGDQLGQLSSEQISDCFRGAGFSPEEVEGYSRVLKLRIEALKKL
jgi:hypothetical protein